MEPNTQNPMNTSARPAPMGTNMGSSNDNGHKKVGPIIATLVIVLILIIAALYLFASRMNQQATPADTGTASATQQQVATQTVKPVTGSKDDPASLQGDLKASLNNVDAQKF